MVTNDLGYIHPHNGQLRYFMVMTTMLFALVEIVGFGLGRMRVILDYFATQRDKNRTIVECAVHFLHRMKKFEEAVCVPL